MRNALLRDIGLLLSSAILTAILYQVSFGTIPWIRPPESEMIAPDSLLFSTSEESALTSTSDNSILTVTYDQVLKLLEDPDVLFIDARPPEEYAQGHIDNAINIYALEFEEHIPDILTWDRDKRIVVYCSGGACELSHDLAQDLKNFGFTHVFVYTGGWEEWSQKHHE